MPSAHAILEEPTPEDSISSVASRADKKLSRHSKSSSVSSVSATKAKATAKRAILEAEAATLETFQAIQREELSLHLRKITKAQAEELVYAEAEASYNYRSSNLWTNAAAKAKLSGYGVTSRTYCTLPSMEAEELGRKQFLNSIEGFKSLL